MTKVEAMQKVDKFKKHLINVETFDGQNNKGGLQKYLHKGYFIRVDWKFSVFEYSSFEPCRYQDKYFVDQSCQ